MTFFAFKTLKLNTSIDADFSVARRPLQGG